MRIHIALLALVVVSTNVRAQPGSYQGQTFSSGEKFYLVNQKSQNFKDAKNTYTEGAQKLQAKEAAFNAEAEKLALEKEGWLQRYRMYDNVISLRHKDKVMAAFDEERKRLGVGDQQGYQRLGVYNAFTGESYLKCFDAKTGELVIAEVRKLYGNLEQTQKDFEQSRNRLAAEETQISQDYQKVLDGYRAASEAKMAKDQAVADAAKAAEAENRAKAQAREAEMERQRLEQEMNQRQQQQQRSGRPGYAT